MWRSRPCAGDADLVSMARPMLADPDLVNKAREGREDEINTCIGCNQACLDHTFTRH
jgi:2,4-dienoyl-CoA reductase (NADPH2)